ncbi:MAG: gamma-glutamyl-gamma-aminobutyrate hydrolase family protein, partial [Pseudomonadota bacterium]|nr:gamma-glutamyl-gamma-aminobutyrate hydrolase family protein [Pseudomonadota bacterium]
MNTLIIDNRDSMTFNLFQQVAEVNGRAPRVVRNDELPWEAIAALDIDNIIISPGPGRPERPADFGVCAQVIRHARVPVLGVCLGHQGIGWLLGGRVCHAPQPVHGRISRVWHSGDALFAGIPSPFAAARYHSLLLAAPLPAGLEATAWTADGLIMGIRCRSRPLWGVQFHPESIGTDCGRRLLANFMGCTGRRRPRAPRPVSPPPRPARPAAELRVHSRRLPCPADPSRLFAALFGHARHAFWLDSSLARPGLARFSFMGDAAGPLAEVVTCRDRTLTLHRNAAVEVRQQSIFEHLRRRLAGCTVRGAESLPFDFAGGYVGYFGYELKRECGAAPGPMARTPDAAWLFADRLVAVDHAAAELWLVCLAPAGGDGEARRWLDAMARRLDRPLPEPSMAAPAIG